MQKQHGYCLLQPSFQYRDSALYYTTAGGEQRQYVSNCNVLCRRCRYQRFLLAQQGAQQVRQLVIPGDVQSNLLGNDLSLKFSC